MFYCPRCKAKVPAEALYCTNCGFNATNARIKSVSNPASLSNGLPRPGGPPPSQSGITAPPFQPGMPLGTTPTMPPPARSIQPETRRVMHPHNTNTPFTASPPSMAPMPPYSNNNSIPGVIPTTPAVIAPPQSQIPHTPFTITKGQSNPSIPTRPATLHTQQPTHAHITPAHLLAIQQSPSAPSTPPTLPTPPIPMQSGQPIASLQNQGLLNTIPLTPQPRQTEPPRPVAINTASTTRSPESFSVTRNAAERWRTSWRNKQRQEAGPATEVSRGQSSVPEPLMAMQHSLARIRAIAKPSSQKKVRIPVFWISIALLACLILGLAIFILSTYMHNATPTAIVNPTLPTPPPTLSMRGTPTTLVQAGHILPIHGEHFAVGDPILFLLDDANSISGSDGKEIAIQVSNQGTFDVNIPIATTWTNGPHVIEATDNKTSQMAYFSIQVSSSILTSINTVPGLSLSHSHLSFSAYTGQSNPAEQFLTLTNSGSTPIPWTAKAVTDNSLNWLTIDTSTTSGTIHPSSVAQVGIKTIVGSLHDAPFPYTGDIILNINGQEQLIVPVSFLVHESAEWIISPNPVIGLFSAQGSTCKPGATLTLINLGYVPIFWHILPVNGAANHIQFQLNGKPHMQGMLSIAGQNGDTQVLTLTCTNVQNGASYPFTVDANNVPWNGSVLIQDS